MISNLGLESAVNLHCLNVRRLRLALSCGHIRVILGLYSDHIGVILG